MTKTAVVTGASTGIGAALTSRLAADGWRVLGLARRTESIRKLAENITGNGEIVAIEADFSDVQDVNSICENVRQRTDRVDLLANIAGVWHDDNVAFYGPPLWELPSDQILDVMNVGIVAPMLLAKGVLPLMFPGNGTAHVVNLSGTFSSGGKAWIHYYVSKKALEQFTLALADEAKGQGVRVNCVSPGDTATEAYIHFFPEDAQGALSPDYIADFIIHLGSPEMRYVNGQIIELRS